jgi:YHS domain-containing protein
MSRHSILVPITLGLLACCIPSQVRSENDKATRSKPNPSPRTAKEALKRFNHLIGGWRGVGQPRRGSAKGAWSEKANWTWQFATARSASKDNKPATKSASVAIRFRSPGSKLIVDGLFAYNPANRMFTLEATMADKTRRTYSGKPGSGGSLVFESKPDAKAQVHRLTIRTINTKRTLMLHERRRQSSTFYTRVAGIGYTREGTRLATANFGPLCIVTEGKGTSKVSYKGKSYWVCCSGCRDAFQDDPEGVLADARKRTAERKKKAAGKAKQAGKPTSGSS